MRVRAVGKPEGCKLLRIDAEISPDARGCPIVASISVNGDFFAVPEEEFDLLGQALTGTELGSLAFAFDWFLAEKGIQTAGIDGTSVARLLAEAYDAASL